MDIRAELKELMESKNYSIAFVATAKINNKYVD